MAKRYIITLHYQMGKPKETYITYAKNFKDAEEKAKNIVLSIIEPEGTLETTTIKWEVREYKLLDTVELLEEKMALIERRMDDIAIIVDKLSDKVTISDIIDKVKGKK